MNPEEFDKTLKNTFKNEYLPPREDLWNNISTQLDDKKKMSYWLLLIPLVLISIGSLFFYNSKKSNPVVAESSPNIISAEVPQPESNMQTIAKNSESKPEPILVNEAVEITKPSTQEKFVQNTQKSKEIETNQNINNPEQISKPINSSSNLAETVDYFNMYFRGLKVFKNKIFNYTIPELVNNEFAPKHTYKSRSYTLNEDAKWWLNFGVAQQFNFNSVMMPSKNEIYVHKELWKNKEYLTSSGNGFAAYSTLSYKFNKNFNIETGFSYGRRTEDIKMDVSSFDIAARNANNELVQYARIKLWYIVGFDTTFYDAIAGFNLAVKNKYNVFSVPLNFNSEFKISKESFIGLTLGSNFSYITAKNIKHYDVVNERIYTETKSRHFNISLNPKISLFTNFNDIGQIGIFSAYQMYMNPMDVANKQYQIKMNDLQLGFFFKKPLNW